MIRGTVIKDQPIDTKNKDLLHRDDIINMISQSILRQNKENSYVIGLTGKWGTGKTSVINMIKEKIFNSVDYPLIIDFNPWEYSETDDLLTPFIRQFNAGLRLKGKNGDVISKLNQYSKIVNLIPFERNYSKIISGIFGLLSLLGITTFNSFSESENIIIKQIFQNYPFVKWILPISCAISFVALIWNKILDFLNIKKEIISKTVSEQKNKIVKLLKSREQKILVIIDDIDRLTPSEILQVFRIVRNNADFPYVTYLLSFDKTVVEVSLDSVLGTKNEGVQYGHDFIEKIINIDFTLPEPSFFVLKEYLYDQLKLLIEKLPESDKKNIFTSIKTNRRWNNICQILPEYLVSIREIKRYLNSIFILFPNIFNEKYSNLNFIDFLGIEAIRLKNYEYYEYIKLNKGFFITKQDVTHEKLDKSWFENSVEKLLPQDIKKLKDLLSLIFPDINYILNTMYGSIDIYTEDEKLAFNCIDTKKYFNDYFSFIPGDENPDIMTNEKIFEVRNACSSVDALNTIINSYIKSNKINELLKNINTKVYDSYFILDIEESINFVQVLFDNFEQIHKQENTWANESFVTEIIYTFIINRNEYEFKKILKKVFNNTKSLYCPIFLIYTRLKQSSNQFDDIEDIYIIAYNKIFEKRADIYSNFYAVNILEDWSLCDKTGNFKSYREELNSDTNKLGNFLDFCFVRRMKSKKNTKNENLMDMSNETYINLTSSFIDETKVSFLEKERNEKTTNYEKYKDGIDFFLDNSKNMEINI